MATLLVSRVRRTYGAHPLQLVLVLASLALAAYVVQVVGIAALWDPDVWWQSIIVWFLGAALAHDLLLFPVYAVADGALRLLTGGLRRTPPGSVRPLPKVPVINYVRIPLMTCGLITLVFFPGIIRQGVGSYHRATGLTQDLFLQRWLILCAVVLLTGVLAYAVARVATRNRPMIYLVKQAATRRQARALDPSSTIPGWAVAVVAVLVTATVRGRRRGRPRRREW